jgi:hypothetical protein
LNEVAMDERSQIAVVGATLVVIAVLLVLI